MELAHRITELLAGERYTSRATSRERGDGHDGGGHGAVLVLQGIEAGQPEDGRLGRLGVPTICSGDDAKVPGRVLRVTNKEQHQLRTLSYLCLVPYLRIRGRQTTN